MRREWAWPCRGAERHTLIQDYAESGARCQDIELFTKSLYVRQVGRLVAPTLHCGINLVMSWVNRAYGHLRMGRRLLVSSCDFIMLPSDMPQYWRIALKENGLVRGLVPYDGSDNEQRGFEPEVTYREARQGKRRTVRVGGDWSFGRVLMEPIFYNPHLSGWWGASVLDAQQAALDGRLREPATALTRYSAQREADAREVYERLQRFAAVGLTHLCHLVERGRLITWDRLRDFREIVGRRGVMPCNRDEFEALCAAVPRAWKEVLDDAASTWRNGMQSSDMVVSAEVRVPQRTKGWGVI